VETHTNGVAGLALATLLWLLAQAGGAAAEGVQAGSAATGGGSSALAPVGALAASILGAPDLVADPILRAWSQPSRSLEARVGRVQHAGLLLGMRSLNGPARALLLDASLGSEAERAAAAVRLAPELPAARAALAMADFHEKRWGPALDELLAALRAIPSSLDARLWLRAAGLEALFLTVLGSGLLFLFVVMATALPSLTRRLSGLHEALPAASRLALVAALLLVPAALGEGVLGTALALAAVGLVQGDWVARVCVVVALATVLVAVYPLQERAAEARVALVADPVALAAYDTEHGLPDASARARIQRAANGDGLAGRAQALREKREGHLVAAEARFRRLLEQPGTPDLWNNAAGVFMARGAYAEAIPLYEAAAQTEATPAILFNLSQAYGRAIRLDDQDRMLAKAQALDASALTELAEQVGHSSPGLVVDVPMPAPVVADRLEDPGAAHALAASQRRFVAPGLSGRSALCSGLAAALAVALGLVLRALLPGSGEEDDLYAGIARLLQGGAADSSERMRRLAVLRARQARRERVRRGIAFVVPGAAGVSGGHPVLGMLAASCFAAGVAAWSVRGGIALDPLVLGALTPMLLPAALLVTGLLYALVTAVALLLTRESA